MNISLKFNTMVTCTSHPDQTQPVGLLTVQYPHVQNANARAFLSTILLMINCIAMAHSSLAGSSRSIITLARAHPPLSHQLSYKISITNIHTTNEYIWNVILLRCCIVLFTQSQNILTSFIRFTD